MRMLRDSILLPVRRQGGSRGAALLYVVGALLVLGALGAGIAVMSPSSTQSKLEQEAGMRAYYNAQSGLQFIYSRAASSSANKMTGTDFMNLMGNDTSKTYYLPDGGQFTYKTVFSAANTTSANYSIAYLAGEVAGSSAAARYTYLLYGGGKGSQVMPSYTQESGNATPPGPPGPPDPPGPPPSPTNFQLFTAGTLNADTSGAINGNIGGDTITFNGGSHVYGSVVQTSTKKALYIIGSYVGGSDAKICSNSTITIDGNVTVVGTVYSKGAVDIENGKVTGDVYANGDVTINSNSTVTGNIYANGDVDIKNGKVIGTVFCTGNVTLENGSSISGDINSQAGVKIKNGSVGGIVHYATTFSACNYCTYGGSDNNVTGFTYVFDCAASYTLPAHTCKDPNQTPSSLNVAYVAPDYNAQYTFVAKESMDDYFSFQDFKAVGGSKICFDLSNGGYITIFVSGTFDLNGDLYVKTSSSDGSCFQDSNKVKNLSSSKNSYASKVYLESCSTSDMSFAGNYDWFGTIYATKDIDFSSGGVLVGAFYSSAGTVNVTGATKTTFVESDYAKKHWGEN